jgi:hypothetical protein
LTNSLNLRADRRWQVQTELASGQWGLPFRRLTCLLSGAVMRPLEPKDSVKRHF